jgi:hypothetical protein
MTYFSGSILSRKVRSVNGSDMPASNSPGMPDGDADVFLALVERHRHAKFCSTQFTGSFRPSVGPMYTARCGYAHTLR